MFEAKIENAKRVEAALAVLRRHARGETVLHAELGAATGLSPSDDTFSAYYTTCQRARNRHRDEDGVTSIPVVDVGFRLLTAQETLVDYQRRQRKRARRQIRKAGRSAAMLPAIDLSMHQRRLREAAIRTARDQERLLSERAARAEETARPAAALPFGRPQGPPRTSEARPE